MGGGVDVKTKTQEVSRVQGRERQPSGRTAGGEGRLEGSSEEEVTSEGALESGRHGNHTGRRHEREQMGLTIKCHRCFTLSRTMNTPSHNANRQQIL